MPIALTDEMRDKLAVALDNRIAAMVITVDREGYPNPSLRGSVMVFDSEHLAYWDRSLRGAFEHIKTNPHVAVWYREPETRTTWRFSGDAVQYLEGDIRDQVMARTHPRELEADPERKGAAVVIKVNKVVDGRGGVVMER